MICFSCYEHPLTSGIPQFQAPKKSQDLLELTISKPGEGGSVRELRFAKVYGFRHMQNLLSSIKDARYAHMILHASLFFDSGDLSMMMKEVQRRKRVNVHDLSLDCAHFFCVHSLCSADVHAFLCALRQFAPCSCSYDYVEVMSCPGGCNNGGGQVRVDKVAAGEQLGSVNRCYDEAGMLSDATAMDAEATLQALRQSGEGCRVLRTKFRVKEMPIQAQIKEW